MFGRKMSYWCSGAALGRGYATHHCYEAALARVARLMNARRTNSTLSLYRLVALLRFRASLWARRLILAGDCGLRMFASWQVKCEVKR